MSTNRQENYTMSTDKTDSRTSQPMDASVREQTTPEAPRVSRRVCYAIQTLAEEVTRLFPETAFETSGPNAFGTDLVVAFHDHESPDLFPLLALIETDERVLSVDRDSIEDLAVVEFHSNLRTQDSRAPFGLAEAHQILSEDPDRMVLDEADDFVIEDEEPDSEPEPVKPAPAKKTAAKKTTARKRSGR